MHALSAPCIHPGDILAGKYRVEYVIGVGGMGMVVAATQIDLGELRAIKFLLPAMAANAEAVERFVREARAAASLRGEHVVRVHDVGRFKSGEPYMVMEYLDGEDLGVIVDRLGPMPPSQVVAYALQALEALAEAHAAGIVHRDLKPPNLFVARDRQGLPTLKILDFGISKFTDGRAGEATGLTGTAVAMGSPTYMAPEQMRSAKSVDARADLWSLGVILYELLTGREPFTGETLAALYTQVLTGEPKPPSSMNPLVQPTLDAVVLRCLAKDREKRFQNAAELAAALAPFGGPDSEHSVGRIRRWLGIAAPVPMPISHSYPPPAPPAGVGYPAAPGPYPPTPPPIGPLGRVGDPRISDPTGRFEAAVIASGWPAAPAKRARRVRRRQERLLLMLSLGALLAALLVLGWVALRARGRPLGDVLAEAARSAASASTGPADEALDGAVPDDGAADSAADAGVQDELEPADEDAGLAEPADASVSNDSDAGPAEDAGPSRPKKRPPNKGRRTPGRR